MSIITKNFFEKCYSISDIHEHLPTLYKYGTDCVHITECGVRNVVSSYAFARSILNKPNGKLVQVDLESNDNIVKFGNECKEEGINCVFYNQSDLECPMEPTDLLFIDTWHIYGHLKRELQRWHEYVRKYIIMHDTTVDEWEGETIRCKWDPFQQSQQTGIPVKEITLGLWPAIEEFLQNHPEWKIKERFTNNNGLTILYRV